MHFRHSSWLIFQLPAWSHKQEFASLALHHLNTLWSLDFRRAPLWDPLDIVCIRIQMARCSVTITSVTISTQLYATFDPRNPSAYDAAVNKLQTCIAQIKDWMLCNKLQLIQSKSDIFVVSSSRSSSKLCDVNLQLGDIRITPSKSQRNLEAMFDPALNMTQQVSSTIHCVSYHLRK